LIGVKAYPKFSLRDLIPYIDWNPFFQVWQLRGKYPNRHYPNIFQDANVGKEAKKCFDDAQAMIQEIIKTGALQARGIVGIFPAHSDGDDIVLYKDDDRKEVSKTLHTLRQQTQKDDDSPYLAMSDFIAPKSSGLKDYIGMFAVSIFGVETLCESLRKQNELYKGIMAQALGDRFAEAYAEKIHEQIRKELWGYAKTESLNQAELLQVKYQGIRPAPGYPSQPDHTEKTIMWELMDVKKEIGIELTESLAMVPASSVSAICFGSKHANYFAVGKIAKDQVSDYAKRKGVSESEAETMLSSTFEAAPSS